LGPVDARVVRVPRIDLMTATGTVASGEDVDAAVIDGPLGEALSREAGFPIDGLLGHSFLRRFRVVFDFVHTILWLEPVAHDYDVRRYEYTHVGVQIERVDSVLVVSGVVEESPAAKAGIERGDELIEVDGRALDGLELIEVIELLEGPPQSGIHLLIRRYGVEHRFDLLREQLL
jgi:membrane-associated protease RseP (regulator of RpoE activity)